MLPSADLLTLFVFDSPTPRSCERDTFPNAFRLRFGGWYSLFQTARYEDNPQSASPVPIRADSDSWHWYLFNPLQTQNLQADPRASLLVTQEDAGADPLVASRVTLVGSVLPVSDVEVAEARKLYLARYANSKNWVDFEAFSFYRMNVVDVYYVGGFGVMGWVSASEYDRSQPDPLADSMAEIIQHMNADHKDALILLAQKLLTLSYGKPR